MTKLRELAERSIQPFADWWWEQTRGARPTIAIALKRVLLGAALAMTVASLVWAVQVLPEWQVRRAGAHVTGDKPGSPTTSVDVAILQNEMRKTFVQVLGGVFVVLALYLTYRRTIVTEQGHITDRYTKAIEQLGATKTVGDRTVPNVEVRLGAIYALERIAFDSPRDHWTIMEVLTAYVRENAPWPAKYEERHPIATEIQANLNVLGRRKLGPKRERKDQWLDLRSSDLRGAVFYKAHMERAVFVNSNVGAAFFDRAFLKRATFYRALVEKSRFNGADITYADFTESKGLAVEQIREAEGWEKARYDEGFGGELEAGGASKTLSARDANTEPKTEAPE